MPDATSSTLYAQKDGWYTVEVSIGSCTTTSQSIQLIYKSLMPKPVLYAYGPDYWFFVCDIRNAEKYRWFYNGNLLAENRNNQYYAGTDYGRYHVEVYDGGDCYIPSDTIVIPLVPAGIGELSSEKKLYLYPNPAREKIWIFYSGSNTGRIQIRIINAEGVIAKEQESWKWAVDFSEDMDVSELKPGIYIMELRPDQVLLKARFIIY